jgi:hypothetical protein
MNLSPLDDRLHLLADQLTAPPTPAAREAIVRRARVLRRRRRVRNAVGGGVLALALVAGVLAVKGEQPDGVEMGPVGPGRRGSVSLPTLTVDLPGWAIVAVEDTSVPADVAGSEDPTLHGSLQVFRRPGDLAGPTVVLHHQAASDPVVAEPGDLTVAIGDTEAYLRRTGEQSLTLRWNADHGHAHARVQAWGLSEDQLIEFADGLRRKDDDISFPPSADDEFGFVASSLPEGIEEVQMNPVNEKRPGVRRLVLEAGERTAEVVINEGGEQAFEAELANQLATAREVDATSVLQHPAVALEHPDDGQWSLIWRHTGQALVIVTLSGVDRSTVADFAAGIREVPEDEWRDMLADHR